jgi:hypothetical protein
MSKLVILVRTEEGRNNTLLYKRNKIIIFYCNHFEWLRSQYTHRVLSKNTWCCIWNWLAWEDGLWQQMIWLLFSLYIVHPDWHYHHGLFHDFPISTKIISKKINHDPLLEPWADNKAVVTNGQRLLHWPSWCVSEKNSVTILALLILLETPANVISWTELDLSWARNLEDACHSTACYNWSTILRSTPKYMFCHFLFHYPFPP